MQAFWRHLCSIHLFHLRTYSKTNFVWLASSSWHYLMFILQGVILCLGSVTDKDHCLELDLPLSTPRPAHCTPGRLVCQLHYWMLCSLCFLGTPLVLVTSINFSITIKASTPARPLIACPKKMIFICHTLAIALDSCPAGSIWIQLFHVFSTVRPSFFSNTTSRRILSCWRHWSWWTSSTPRRNTGHMSTFMKCTSAAIWYFYSYVCLTVLLVLL